MSRYIDADVTLETLKEFLIKTATNNVGYKRDVDEVCKDIADNRLSVWMEYVPTADVVEADNVQKTVETYCTDNCYHNAHCMEMYKDVDDAVEYLERKCEKCPLRELRDLDMRGENNELHKRL